MYPVKDIIMQTLKKQPLILHTGCRQFHTLAPLIYSYNFHRQVVSIQPKLKHSILKFRVNSSSLIPIIELSCSRNSVGNLASLYALKKLLYANTTLTYCTNTRGLVYTQALVLFIAIVTSSSP